MERSRRLISCGKNVNAWLWATLLAVSGLATGQSARAVGMLDWTSSITGQYRLIFVTSGVTSGTSTDIATYNTFVSDSANAVPELQALNTTWKVVGSTLTVEAIDNTDTNWTEQSQGLPVYTLSGTLVANSYKQLYSGTLVAPPNFTEQGYEPWTSPKTGTLNNGHRSVGYELGSVGGQTNWGWSYSTNDYFSNWTDPTQSGWWDGEWLSVSERGLYGMSGVLGAVPVPEPSTIALACCGAALGAVAIRRRRKTGR